LRRANAGALKCLIVETGDGARGAAKVQRTAVAGTVKIEWNSVGLQKKPHHLDMYIHLKIYLDSTDCQVVESYWESGGRRVVRSRGLHQFTFVDLLLKGGL